jgi:diacylglycerol kinase family enzyme
VVSRGDPWGTPHEGAPDLVVAGDDAALAAAVATRPGAVVRFVPDGASDLARVLGLETAAGEGSAAPLDALRLADDVLAVNMIVSGVAPARLRARHRRRPCTVWVDDRPVFEGRATTVVIANGQFLDGGDLVPRGHPGDGRLEVQVYALAAGQRRGMRRRLPTGTHVPHPEIHAFQGRAVRVAWGAPTALRIDGSSAPLAAELAVSLVPHAFAVLL